MMETGLEAEVRGLLESGVSPKAQSMQALGYKEMVPCIWTGDWSLEKAVEEIRKGTRHYAKRQETFLRRENGMNARMFPTLAARMQKILDGRVLR